MSRESFNPTDAQITEAAAYALREDIRRGGRPHVAGRGGTRDEEPDGDAAADLIRHSGSGSTRSGPPRGGRDGEGDGCDGRDSRD